MTRTFLSCPAIYPASSGNMKVISYQLRCRFLPFSRCQNLLRKFFANGTLSASNDSAVNFTREGRLQDETYILSQPTMQSSFP